ncbi:DUF3649 domain-containing protein [Alloalcanivorax gelatiniphagus]|uniref:Iron transporter n=1 Tax=Alloalcanivorax gelatiniphagus TaxID=1194167 RepID=A0ABY2XN48_9GAMM|nr:iron transporter [Alloalcanivorax gelatiniphagus]TMW12889.1 iron transporter [Alloalcanivorax gelatiniphagus]|tara:strand:+ start:7844 stop:8140 length:297 start_codon:yes stop_codon:yes gene_type:complete
MSKISSQRLAGSPRLGVALRALFAVFGGYGLAAASATAMALWLPMTRADAVITGTLLSFLVYAVAVLWAFSARSVARAGAGILIPAALCAALAWLGGA